MENQSEAVLSAEPSQERPPLAPLNAPGPQEPQFVRIPTPAPSHSSNITRTSKSSVRAQQLAIKAQYAKRVAELESEHEKIELARQLRVAELEAMREKAEFVRQQHIADLELQAKLAAVEAAASGHPSITSREKVESWLEHNDKDFDLPLRSQVKKPFLLNVNPVPEAGRSRQRSPQHKEHAFNSLGTLKTQNCNQNKDLLVSQERNDIKILAQAITDLAASRPGNVSFLKLPSFSGRALDWLPFKKVFDQTQAGYSANDNLARLNAALCGAARDAVSSLLLSSCDPAEIMSALQLRFGRPEFIVLQEVAAMQALPKLPTIDSCKELNVLACRVRNCVATIKLLNYDAYLSSPELFNTILSKLTPLLRTRWADYANSRNGCKYKLDLLSDFLMHEAELQVQYGLIAEPALFHKSSFSSNNFRDNFKQHRDVIKNKNDVVNTVYGNGDNVNSFKNNNSIAFDKNVGHNFITTTTCLYCRLEKHSIDNCKKFIALSIDDRWHWVYENKLCRRCLKRGGHLYRRCKNSCNVGNCTLKHHSLLHKDTSEITSHIEPTSSLLAVEEKSSVKPDNLGAFSVETTDFKSLPSTSQVKSDALVTHSSLSKNKSRPLLKVVAVTVSGPKGEINTYALLDDGSTATLVDSSIVRAIGAQGPKSTLTVNCIGGLSNTCEASFVDFSIRGRHSTQSYNVRNARSIPNLGISRQSLSVSDIQQFYYLHDLVDVLCYDDIQPSILIGVDNWNLTIPYSTRRGTTNQPVAIETALGWVLYGFNSSKSSPVHFVNHAFVESESMQLDNSLEQLIKENYKLDSIGIVKKDYHSEDETRAIAILEETTRRLPTGRFETGLIWRSGIEHVPDSRSLALSRFRSLEKRFCRDPEFATSYKNNIEAMLSKDYAELCLSKPCGKVTWYLPHFGVVHPQKRKLRVVHDAAATVQGVSLNSLLLKGPDVFQPLLAILMRFREGKVALNADIREMFPQIKIRVEDRDAQRFFWRSDSSQPIAEYRMSSMIFGATSSPFTALYLKNKNAKEYRHDYPAAADAILRDTYMDDYLGSVNTVEEAIRLASDIVYVNARAGLEMRSWSSNVKESLASLPVDLCAPNTSSIVVRVLGQSWNINDDTLHFSRTCLDELPTKLTKRAVLSHLMKVYDPLGFLTPIVIRGRIYFQQTWRLNIDWDQQIPPEMAAKWWDWFSELQNYITLSIPRYYVGDKTYTECQLHIFADASEHAYACVAYWRFQFVNGAVKLSLIGGKARLAPLKPASIPRLELQAALIAARFGNYILEAHRFKPTNTVFWSDSLTVLRWLRSDARTFKAFVAHRVGEILELTDVSSWRYVPTSDNVADDATRPDAKFKIDSRWFTGPSFLISSKENWPTEPSTRSLSFPNVSRHQETIGLTNTSPQELLSPVVADHTRFSIWIRLVRATARLYKCFDVFRSLLIKIRSKISSRFSHSATRRLLNTTTLNLPLLSAEDIIFAEQQLLIRSQRDSFNKEITSLLSSEPINKSRLARIALYMDADKVLRVSGRTAAVKNLPSLSHGPNPMILDGDHPIVQLFIRHYHYKFMHGYNEAIVNELRQCYHILRLRPTVKKIARSCLSCRRRKITAYTPQVGDLPEDRLTPSRSFSRVGLDYFGPINVQIGRRTEKRWVALFTCMVVRAVHLEIVNSLTSDSAIMALRRFIARRGCPEKIFSDNGTAFVGASRLLPDIFEFASNNKISWTFIPPAAPFMGGCWERLVRSIKSALATTLKSRSPKEEILNTFLLEAEAVVNSRPLTHVPVDADAEFALTPFHFLLGSSSNGPPLQTLYDSDLIGRRDWKKGLRLADHFWQRWTKEYLPIIRTRPSTLPSNQAACGDVVVVVDGNLPRSSWPLGKITKVWPGKDGVVRVAEVATKGGILKRPTKMLAPLIRSSPEKPSHTGAQPVTD